MRGRSAVSSALPIATRFGPSAFVGMSMFDLLRNMWSWGGPYGVNSSLMDMVLSWFEG